jgi:hypothetical protein
VTSTPAFLALALVVLASAPAVPRFVAGPDSAHPRLLFADSLVSVNDRCIVAGNKLNPRIRPVYVNRRPIGFC